jgi:DNA-binding HxlR family transcriptional regulator
MESNPPMPQPILSSKSCPIALSLDRVGDGWSMMILRDAARGLMRFDQFEKSLGIAPNILSRRLRRLVEAGLLEKSRYSEHPPRDAYLLTERGRDFRPVLWALFVWGNKHFVPEGQEVVLVDRTTGQPVNPTATNQTTSAVKAVVRSVPHNTQARGQS